MVFLGKCDIYIYTRNHQLSGGVSGGVRAVGVLLENSIRRMVCMYVCHEQDCMVQRRLV